VEPNDEKIKRPDGRPDGRSKDGKFTKGNSFSKGNPHARTVSLFRKSLFASVTEADIQDVACALLTKAKAGDTASAVVLLRYCCGAPTTETWPIEDKQQETEKIYKILDLVQRESLVRLLQDNEV